MYELFFNVRQLDFDTYLGIYRHKLQKVTVAMKKVISFAVDWLFCCQQDNPRVSFWSFGWTRGQLKVQTQF